MTLLAIETTGAYASVALLEEWGEDAPGGGLEIFRRLYVIHGKDRFSHLQNLTPQIEQILQEHGLIPYDIAAVAVSHGPGSFTGIRIGVSTARALSQVLDIPCIPVSSLEALALRAATPEAAIEVTADTLICPILDARRKQVYGAAYTLADGTPICRIAPASCLMTEFLEKLDQYLAECAEDDAATPRQVLFIGDGIDTCGDIIEQWIAAASNVPGDGSLVQPPEVFFAPKEIRYQDAATVAMRGNQLFWEDRTCGYMELQPEYLRMAEAEKKLRDKLAAEAGASGNASVAGSPSASAERREP